MKLCLFETIHRPQPDKFQDFLRLSSMFSVHVQTFFALSLEEFFPQSLHNILNLVFDFLLFICKMPVCGKPYLRNHKLLLQSSSIRFHFQAIWLYKLTWRTSNIRQKIVYKIFQKSKMLSMLNKSIYSTDINT
jgi:hypothetical protein